MENMDKVGVIFDFNGTLFWDSEYQETSWDQYLKNHNIYLTKEQKRKYIHGRNAKDTFEILFNRRISKTEVEYYTEEKEILYRNECLKHKMDLAPGAKSLLKFLKSNEIPLAIATASGRTNVDFFIDNFDLLNYFERKHIIFDDGTMRGKPFPDLFLKAIDVLGVKRSMTIIFEDSESGIQAALNSKVSKVIIVNSTKEKCKTFDLPIIEHFDEFDRNILTLLNS